jgi:hypothetical protein
LPDPVGPTSTTTAGSGMLTASAIALPLAETVH